jgi:hypothetical protein
MKDNPLCGGCGRSEAECAREDCECCELCTHTFDGGETRKFICVECRTVQIAASTGQLPVRCKVCAWYRYQRRKRIA